MDRGIYAASSGGLMNARKLDVVGHNLANVNTVGYKAERLTSKQQEFSDTLAGILPGTPKRAALDQEVVPGVVNVSTVTDFSQGPVNFTGNPLNVALTKENQFFVVQSPEGEAFTRAGNFTTDQQGNLVTADGSPVLGEGGPLTINGAQAGISGNGSVVVDGNVIGKVRIVEIDDLKQLKRSEGTRFLANGASSKSADSPELITNSVEMANTGVVGSMVDMISANKSFESYAKVVQTISELNEQSLRTPRSA